MDIIAAPCTSTRQSVSFDPSWGERYRGRYQVERVGVLDILLTATGLALCFNQSPPMLPLLAEDTSHFFLADRDFQVNFPPRGPADQLIVTVNGSNFTGTRER